MDGDPSGRIKHTLANWTGVAYKIPHTELEKCKGLGDLSQSGIYFLFGTSDDTGDSVVYIGQAARHTQYLKNELFYVIMLLMFAIPLVWIFRKYKSIDPTYHIFPNWSIP